MAQDALTTQKLVDTFQIGNEALKQRIDAVSSLARVLDGPPAKYTPMRIDGTKIDPFGVYSDYRRLYATLYGAQPEKEGTIQLGAETVTCPYRVLTVLKTLIYCGITKSADRASACRHLFGAIVSRRKGEVLNEELMQPALRSTGDYYKDEIIRAIIDSVYSPQEQVIIALKDALKDAYTDDVLKLFPTVHDVDSLEEEVRKQYKRACCDASFKVRKHAGRIVNVVNYLRRSESDA